ncbi:NADH-quinone oxidoreductase subunit C [Paenibacillus sp. IB182496]|uniref:NADH-quinone oxidoreductase subunit C n=1 Tax=Paenibacillus sabuli TaxID=2772509 RepID=A0A927GS33_9BACL|nr:NADH-quinone oxidoreductase subunit C [Paenibacillus sabuli]MBD2845881.1 NADH-quinone oxidoreductase subunit C [Paenibacillus sabuli]
MSDPSETPAPNQPRLEAAAALVKAELGEDALEEAYLNALSGDAPTLVLAADRVDEAAALFRSHETLRCTYLRNLSGIDCETHMEVIYHLMALESGEDYVLKTKLDREAPSVPSVTAVWPAANWNEREAYDLLGIVFTGHPDLRRIMMPDDWEGHPLRKDYAPLDSEV